MEPKRVVITGLGLVSPIGHTLSGFWNSIVAGQDGLRHIPQHRSSPQSYSLGGVIEDNVLAALSADYHSVTPSRSGLMATIAGNMAMEDAAAGGSIPTCTTICIGSMFSAIPSPTHRDTRSTFFAHDPSRTFNGMTMDSPDKWEWISQGSASGLAAICRGADLIRLGHQQMVVAGGVDTPFEYPYVLDSLFDTARSLCGSPSRGLACHPNRDTPAFVPGEAAAMVVLESREHAIERGARIYGEWLGWAARMSDSSPLEGEKADQVQAMVMRRACGNSREMLESITLCCLTGLGVPEHDRAECDAVRAVWPMHEQIPYSTTISQYTGHVFAAGGPLQIIMALLAIDKATLSSLPLTTVTEIGRLPTPCDKWSRERTRRALILGSGFGGYCVAVVLSTPDGHDGPSGSFGISSRNPSYFQRLRASWTTP